MEKHQLVIIGGGSAGIAAALGAYENGLRDILIIERESEYGGILQQLIANHIDVTRVKKPIVDVDYSDFFNIKENFEYYYEEQ